MARQNFISSLSNAYLALGQCRSLLQCSACTLKLVKLLHLEQRAGALGSRGLAGNVIAFEQLLVLGFEERIARRRLRKDEKRHPVDVMPLTCGEYPYGSGRVCSDRKLWLITLLGVGFDVEAKIERAANFSSLDHDVAVRAVRLRLCGCPRSRSRCRYRKLIVNSAMLRRD